jgi:intein/homing endonuclease
MRTEVIRVKHLGDITKINGAEIPVVDIITGGSPCQDLSVAGLRKGLQHNELGDEETTRSGLFMEQLRIVKEMRASDSKCGRNRVDVRPRYMVWENVCFSGDTLVPCETGYKQISKIVVGDRVKTKSGLYMPVAKIHKTPRQDVIRVKLSGSEDLLVTPNHPIYARVKEQTRTGRIFHEPTWVPAGELTPKHMVAYKIDVPDLPSDFITEEEAWAVGRWLADGSVDLTKSNPRIFISCGLKKANDVRNRLSFLPYPIHENMPHPNAINFAFTSSEFYSLIASAGIGAGNKQVPTYVFRLPFHLQKCVLDGYLSGDGSTRCRYGSTEVSATTASRELAYGVARLIRNVYRVGVGISVRHLRDGRIGGRIIKANYPAYSICATIDGKYTTHYVDSEFVWQPVKAVSDIERRINVYNLSVLEDNTYGANDIVVHNCGAFSVNQGKDFQAVLTEIVRVIEPDAPDVPMPEKGWPYAGCVYDELGGWSVAYRVHDAQYWGVPQRRRRIALVADFNGLSAPEILFDPQLRGEAEDPEPDKAVADPGAERRPEVPPLSQGLSGHYEPSGEARKGTAGGPSESTDGTGCSVDTYSVPSMNSEGMLSNNPQAGFHISDVARTVDPSGLNPACYQGGAAVVGYAVDCRNGTENPFCQLDSAIEERGSQPQHQHGCKGPKTLSFQNTGHGWWNESDVATSVRTPAGGGGKGANIVAGFSFGQSAKARSLGYQEEVSPTIRGGEGGNQKPHIVIHEE